MPTELPVFPDVDSLRAWVASMRQAGKTIGLVPTMGALHAGHLSLVEAARRECDAVITTIFVNPTQFGPREDLAKYPRTLQEDLEKLQSVQCDAVFAPDESVIYPAGFSTFVEPPAVAQTLEGACRPGHFRGVATIVLKLFGIAHADAAYFGQKDFQQAAVIERMVADLNFPIRVVVCPIVREADGLAMSSRNRYLSPADRRRATALSRALFQVEKQVAAGESDAAALQTTMREFLESSVDRIEYTAIVDRCDLAPIQRIDRPAVALIAAFVGQTRLIDNILLTPDVEHACP